MAAVLACGPDAVLSHRSAAALWGIRKNEGRSIGVSVRFPRDPRRAGIRVHRRRDLGPGEITQRLGIPVTSPACSLIDLATAVPTDGLEAAISEADKHGLTDPDRLRTEIDRSPRRPGAVTLRKLLDSRTFALTDSQLERRFLPLARAAGLPPPQTRSHVNGFRVDFFWPDLGLVVETDGLRYHRTPSQQARDRLRDQTHAAAGLTALRFTHAQVTREPAHVLETLRAVAQRLDDATDRMARPAARPWSRPSSPHGAPG